MSVRPVALVFAEEKDPTSWRSITSWERSPEPTAQMESHDPRDRPWSCLAVSHLLSHMQQKLSVAFIHATHQPAELGQKTGVFAGAAPVSLVRSLAFREIGQLRRFLAVVEELIERDLKCAGHFLQRLESPEPCGRFRRGRCNNAEGQCAFRCPLEKTSFLHVVPEGGHRLSCRGLSHPQEQKGQPGSFAGPCPTLSSALPSC